VLHSSRGGKEHGGEKGKSKRREGRGMKVRLRRIEVLLPYYKSVGRSLNVDSGEKKIAGFSFFSWTM